MKSFLISFSLHRPSQVPQLTWSGNLTIPDPTQIDGYQYVVFNILAEFHEGRKNLSLSIKFYEPSILLSSLYSGTNNMGSFTLFNVILRGGIYE